MSKETEWADIETIATELAIPLEAITEAVRAGQLPAIKIGSYIRINRQMLRELVMVPVGIPVSSVTPATVAPTESRHDLPIPLGLTWLDELTPGEPFIFGWPQQGGGQKDEDYTRAWEGTIRLHHERFAVKVGEAIRDERGRLTVFFKRAPICEFVDTLDGQYWASLVKPDGKKVLPIGTQPPALYRDVRLQPYREATGLSGSGVPKALAVVLPRDDHRSAVHHAAARWLGRQHLPIEPAL